MGRRRFHSETPQWRKADGLPLLKPGDWVYPTYRYPQWPAEEARQVAAVQYNEVSDRWTLVIYNPGRYRGPGYSNYNPRNFIKKESPMGLFIGVKLENGGLTAQHEDLNITIPRATFDEVVALIQERIEPGEEWTVFERAALVKGEEPRPPITVVRMR